MAAGQECQKLDRNGFAADVYGALDSSQSRTACGSFSPTTTSHPLDLHLLAAILLKLGPTSKEPRL
jgi:hypothetical protein